MKASKLVTALLAIATTSAFAQSNSGAAGEFVERNINQQQRIEQGLKSGELTTREAARLEREESRVERMESKALRDGKVTANEAQRINEAQNRVSNDIYREKHDAQRGDPNSPSSQRMQADVQRNINQQQRIQQGVQSGSLTQREAGRLERGESHINRMEARAGADGHVGRQEQQRIQRAENQQSRRIFNEKHDGQRRQGMNGDRFGQRGQGGGQGQAQSQSGNGPQGNNGNHYGQQRNGNNGNHYGQQGGRHTLAHR